MFMRVQSFQLYLLCFSHHLAIARSLEKFQNLNEELKITSILAYILGIKKLAPWIAPLWQKLLILLDSITKKKSRMDYKITIKIK
jgi:hypothetical protein